MKTRTTIETPSSDIKISHDNHIVTLGSCFADRVGSKLDSLKFPGSYNPFGIFYNPISILNSVRSALYGHDPVSKHYCILDGMHLHHDYHSNLSARTREAYQELINSRQEEAKENLKTSDNIIITLGSAFVYEHIASGKIITNCHKQGANQFNRRLLSYQECVTGLTELVNLLVLTNPDIHIILTISPIRHTRDTLVGNSRSKSILINAVHDIVDKHQACTYFPAYEIMIDDLRDYRYYEEDMLHPTSKAFDYIWGLFSEVFIDADAQDLNKRIQKILDSLAHRPFRIDSPAHQKFIQNTLAQIENIEKDYPGLKWNVEKNKLLTIRQS